MTDPLVRGVIALLVIGVPVGLVWLRQRPTRVRSGHLPSSFGPFPTLLFFTSVTCPTCPPAREVVEALSGGAHREYAWPADTKSFHALGVGEVPAAFVVGAGGRIVELFRGVPDARRLRRAIVKAGIQAPPT